MVWQFMKTREEQNTILKVGIKDFFLVINVLHIHMKRNTVMRTKFDAKLKAIEKVCQAAVLTAKKAKNIGNKAHNLAVLNKVKK